MTVLLVAAVAAGVLVMAGLGHSKLNLVTEENALIRIDRAARAAGALTVAQMSDRFDVVRDADGRPTLINLRHDSGAGILRPGTDYDALLQTIAKVNQGAANFFRFNAQANVFDRFSTTFRGPNGAMPPPMAFGPAHPAFHALTGQSVYLGQAPVLGRLRLAYFVPVIDLAGATIGALAFDVGWVDDLVSARTELRENVLVWTALILIVLGAVGALLLYLEMKPLRALARLAHDLAAGMDVAIVPNRDRQDEIGDLAEGLSRVVELQGRLENLAYSDPLTGVGNRARYFQQLEKAIAEVSARGQFGALLLLDLDRFKEANDAFGQAGGDELLLKARDLMLAELNEGDFLARLAGDDFAIICPMRGDEMLIEALCYRLVERFAEPVSIRQGMVHTGISIGYALFSQQHNAADIVHRNADLALRHAKAEGRGRVVRFTDELNDAAQRRMSLAHMLRAAMEQNELTVNLQPQVRLKDSRIFGFEALARWPHPTRGMIPPSEFIPVAEATGLIAALGNRVLDESARIAREWLDAGFAFGHVAVNVSPIQLWQPNFVSLVADVLERHRLPSGSICLEVTESIFVNHDEARVAQVFRDLRALGVILSLDDFGSGYSSLGYLNTLPLDQLKIDRRFITGVDRDARQRSLLGGIVALGKGLRLQLVAEGVESEAEIEVLREIGCPIVQGYYFGRPQPALMAPVEADRIRRDHAPPPRAKATQRIAAA
jgi:diguanylate cyclase (GGDEF)-like protein